MSLVERDDPILRETMPEYVGDVRTLKPLAKRLFEELLVEHGEWAISGIGMAAPCIGERVRMFVMNTKALPQRKWASTYVCINPVVLDRRGEPVEAQEMSLLKIPDNYTVARHEEIRVEYTDLTGKRRRDTLRALEARCFLHQLDHLNGVTLWAAGRIA